MGFVLVLLEDGIFSKLAVAYGADVGGGSVVGTDHVSLEVVAFGKFLSADWALVWFFSSMCPHVPLKVVIQTEGLGADGATEWFFPCVDPQVTLDVLAVFESLVAEGAGIPEMKGTS